MLPALLAAGLAALAGSEPTSPRIRDYRAFLASPAASNGTADAAAAPALQWMAPFFSGGGYCSEAIAFLQGLAAPVAEGGLGPAAVSIVQHGDGYSADFVGGLDRPTQALLTSASRRRPGRPLASVCHSEPGAWHPPRWPTTRCPAPGAALTIGRTMFETDRLPAGWQTRLNAMDEVWVPSSFAYDVFVTGGVRPEALVVVPEPVDTDFFTPSGEAGEAASSPSRHRIVPPRTPPACVPGTSPSCPFRFLAVGKWERRKNLQALVRAFLLEFAPLGSAAAAGRGAGGAEKQKSEEARPVEVELWILTSQYHSTVAFDAAIDEFIAAEVVCGGGGGEGEGLASGEDGPCLAPHRLALRVDGSVPGPSSKLTSASSSPAASETIRGRIRVLHGIPGTELPSLYRAMDVFVLPSRGEGWGRPHVEAMACGLPIIATNWSGPVEYMTPANSYPLQVSHFAPIPDGAFAGHLQAEADGEHLRALLRHTATHPDEVRVKGTAAREDMVRLYSPSSVARFVRHQLAGALREKQERAAAAAASGDTQRGEEL